MIIEKPEADGNGLYSCRERLIEIKENLIFDTKKAF